MIAAFSGLNSHPELVSGSRLRPQPLVYGAEGMLKQVQHDEVSEN